MRGNEAGRKMCTLEGEKQPDKQITLFQYRNLTWAVKHVAVFVAVYFYCSLHILAFLALNSAAT